MKSRSSTKNCAIKVPIQRAFLRSSLCRPCRVDKPIKNFLLPEHSACPVLYRSPNIRRYINGAQSTGKSAPYQEPCENCWASR